ncbi:MAG: response regulator [Rhodospirillales bacterium]|nr:response regulator [Rhodospirillales bacterium]
MIADEDTLKDLIARLEKRLEREKNARLQAEQILDQKSNELYKLNQELSGEARLMKAAIINANDGVIITDADLENGPYIIYVNEAFTKISGYDPFEIIGKTPRILQGDDTDRTILHALGDCLREGTSFKGELKNYHKDGSPYWLDISIVPVRNEQGIITNFAAIERDITERKNQERDLRHAKKEAETANFAKSNFLATMSHELRTPMNGIIGLSDLLLDTKLTSEQKESIDAINRSAEGLLVLLNDILDLSKIEAQEMSLENIPFDLRQIIHETISLLKNQAQQKDLVLSSHYAPSVPDWIRGDPARIRQIITNLIGNALKFTEAGYVSLNVSSEKNYILFRVDDTGIGIPENRLDDIFMKFTQADETTTRRFGGTGLGLTICKNIVEMMGGEIGVQSIVGRGSTFWFKIPLIVYTPTEEEISFTQNASGHFDSIEKAKEGLSVLIVDDHPVNLMFARKLLKKIGIERVQLADNGQEALEYVQTFTYNIILMDCQMPDMDGFETTRAIREFQKQTNVYTPVIALTANAMKGDRERCLSAGMDDYLTKPIKVDALSETIARWDSVSRNRQQIKVSELDIPPGDITPEEIPPEPACPLDLEHFNFMFEDSEPEEQEELLSLFKEQAELSLETLTEYCRDGEQVEWKKAAHKLKGSAANLGASDLAAVCATAEQALSASQFDKEKHLQDIRQNYDLLIAYIAKMI